MKIYIGPSGSGKTRRFFLEIRNHLPQTPRRNIIYIAPEQVTMKLQKELLEYLPGHSLMGVQVLSFKRLAYQVLSGTGMPDVTFLSDTGKCMVLVKIARDHQDELQYYGRNITKRGFIGQMKLMITEIVQYGLTEDNLRQMAEAQPEGSILKAKLSDIALLWHYFLEYTGEHVLASESLLDLMAGKIRDSRLLKDAFVYIDDFNGFTTQEYRIIGELTRYAAEVNIALTMTEGAFEEAEQLALARDDWKKLTLQPFFTVQKTLIKLIGLLRDSGQAYETVRLRKCEKPAELIHVLNAVCHMKSDPWPRKASAVKGHMAADPAAEVRFVFCTILKLLRDEGYRLSDVALLVPGLEEYEQLIRREARLFSFPVFVDSKLSASQNPYLQYLETLGELAVSGFSRDNMIRLMKTGLLGIAPQKADLFENQMIEENLQGIMRIREGLEKTEDEELVRLSLDLGRFYQAVRGQNTASAITGAYQTFTEARGIPETLENIAQYLIEQGDLALAAQYRRIYEEASKVQEELISILGSMNLPMREYTEIFQMGLEQCKLGQTPPSLEELLVGDLKRTHLSSHRMVIIMGIRGGFFPWTVSNPGLLTENERERLGKSWDIASGEREKLAEQYYLLYTAMGKAREKILFTGCLSGMDGKAGTMSALWRRLSLVAGEDWIQDGEEDSLLMPLPMIYDTRKPLSPALKAYFRTHGYASQMDLMERGKHYQLEDAVLSPQVSRYLLDPSARRLSITQLESYASCPYGYFLSRGLHLQERREPTVRALEDGNVLHDILKEAGSYLDQGLTREEADTITAELAGKREAEFAVYQTSGRYKYYWKKLQQTAARALYILSEQAALSDFKGRVFEWPFGGVAEDGSFDKKSSEVKIGGVSLAGKIDRIDVLDEDGSRFLQVIDYKSGTTSYDPASVYEGLTLQLPVYLQVAGDRFNAAPAGFFYFHLSQSPIKNEDGSVPDPAGDKDRQLKASRLDGVFLDDTELAKRMDHSLEDGKGKVLNASITAKGQFHANNHKATPEQLHDLELFTARKISEIAENMKQGNIPRYPVKQKDTVCTYCPYRGACAMDERLPGAKIHQIARMDDAEFWEKIKT